MNETGIPISIHGNPPCPTFSMSQGIDTAIVGGGH
jgi:hypothetical protein